MCDRRDQPSGRAAARAEDVFGGASSPSGRRVLPLPRAARRVHLASTLPGRWRARRRVTGHLQDPCGWTSMCYRAAPVTTPALLAQPSPPARSSQTWVEVLQSRAAAQPDQIAFTWLGADAQHDTSISLTELDRRARAIGATLQHHGPPGERVLLLLAPGLDFVAALFGCFYAGWIAVPAYPPPLNLRLERIRSVARDARALVALTSVAIHARLEARLVDDPDLAGVRWLDIDAETAPVDDWRPPSIGADNLAVLQYTSGSTAVPRGVMLTHANLRHNVAQIQQRFA